MKIAKVSPIYEGKLGKRGREGDEEDEGWRSRMARIDARARMRNLRSNYYPRAPPAPAPAPVPLHAWPKTMITTGATYNSKASSPGGNQEIIINETGNHDDDDVVTDLEVWTKELINFEADDENERKEITINVDDKKETEEQKTETETAPAEGPEDQVGCYGWFVGLEEWPMTWSFEEEWLWWGRAPLGLGSQNPGWEYISGVGWIENPPS